MKPAKLLLLIFIFLALILFPAYLLSDVETGFELNGTSSFSVNPNIKYLAIKDGPPRYTWQKSIDTRIVIQWFASENSTAELHYQAGLFATLFKSDGNTDFSTGMTSHQGFYRLDDISARPYDSIADINGLFLEQNLDRLNWTSYQSLAHITLGRQAVNLSTARFISPTDIFRPNTARYLVSDYSPGIDAARAQVYLSDLATLDIGIVGGYTKQQTASFARIKANINSVDWSATGITLNDKHIVSAGLDTALGDYGHWQELALMNATTKKWRWSIGADTTIGNYLAQVEYHYNQPGSSTSLEYMTNATDDLFYLQGAIGFYGQHYLTTSFSWLKGMRSGRDLTVILNLKDNSSLSIVNYYWSLTDNWDVTVGLHLPIGTSPEIIDNQLIVNSEFGVSPAVLLLKVDGHL